MRQRSSGRVVDVIIAARDAEDTIALAVKSALREAEVSGVIVVDDASRDGTGMAASQAAQGDARFRLLTATENVGPAAARNLALMASSAPYIAILDADDAFRPGRFAHLLSLPDWDMAADNIVFAEDPERAEVPEGADRIDELKLAAFIRGNISCNGRIRGELGFLKPVIRRAFLDAHALRYEESLRLGEDYDLYVRLLLAGARFKVSHRTGYLARVRDNSLSAAHRADDLRALHDATGRHLAAARSADERSAIRAHRTQVRDKLLLRDFLAKKRAGGMRSALAFATRPPSRVMPIATGVLRDKINLLRGTPPVARVLLADDAGPSART